MNIPSENRYIQYIQSWLSFRYKHEEVPGFVVAVARNGEVLMNEAYGYSDLETQSEMRPDHLFRIASHSKTFTATAIMQLQENGKLRIDDSVVTYVPWLAEHKDKRWLTVTIRQLMSHSAGVIRDGLISDYWSLRERFPDSEQLKELVLSTDLVVDANVKMKYSNIGYSILGELVELVSGDSYNTYVNANIVTPLGLANTGPELTSEIQPRLVTGYSRRDFSKRRLPIDHIETNAMSAATGFYSSATDLCQYFTAQFIGSGHLLSDESKKEMQRAQWGVASLSGVEDSQYGLGLDIVKVGDRKTIGHGGGFPGHITRTYGDPKEKLVVVVLTNCLSSPVDDIAKGIYHIIDFFQKNDLSSVANDNYPSHLEGRYMNLWGVNDIVFTSEKIVSASPDSWYPFKTVEELISVGENTLLISKTGGFYAENEKVKFNVNEDMVVSSINYAGSTMWPENEWVKNTDTNDRIGPQGF